MQSDKVNHLFKPNSKFKDAIALYNFDRELRILLFDVIERIEISHYGNLKPTIISKDTIASELKTVNHTYLHSWLQSISQIRNICAHHGRLWNKNLTIKPRLLSTPPAPWITHVPPVQEHHRLYIHACCLKYLLDVISPGHHYKTKLAELFAKYPSVDLSAMGFTQQWQQEPLWA
jgi:abortive infection bacteriophage resistance protein